MNRIALILLLFAGAVGGGVGVLASIVPLSTDILLTQGYGEAIDGQPNSARVYFRIENTGGPDRLLDVRSTAADSATLYSPEAPNGVPIPAGSQPSLAIDGVHIVLNGLSGVPIDGQLLPVELTFEEAGRVSGKARFIDRSSPAHPAHSNLFGFGGICIIGDGEPAPSVAMDVEASDTSGWTVNIAAADFDFREDLLDWPHVPGTGHGHLYVGGIKVKRIFRNSIQIGALPAGEHVIRVSLNTNDHRAYVVDDEPVSVSAVVNVD